MRPLDGVRVADFTIMAAGPYCALMLALLGADVIRVESRARLDISRRPHPLYGRFDIPDFDHLSGHKRSITLNLKHEQGATIARELVAASDVAVENFRPGVMERLGLGWEQLREVNPQLVMLSLSAYGQTGPESRRPGYAPIFAAEGGLGHMTGYPDGPPGEIRNQMDHEAGLLAAFLIVSMLDERERTGAGNFADLAAREVAAMLVGESLVQAIETGDAPRMGTGHELWAPHGVYPAAGEDRWIAIAVRSDEEWARLVQAMGSPDWCTPELAAESGRRARLAEVDGHIEAWTRTREARDLAVELQAAGVCADISMSAEDIAADEHLRERGAVGTLRHPEHGERTEIGAPWRFDLADVVYDRWSPDLGQHNEEVICGLLGHSREELDRWVEEQVVH